MLIIELNEYNPALLRTLADRCDLAMLQKVLKWKVTETVTDDQYDSGYLEPWVQWVSVHTGTPSSAHQIKNLGEVPLLQKQQIWEAWSEQGRRSIVWGVMNGDRRSAENCVAFLPDPWTFSEAAHPDKYADLLELPRYLAKNYLEISKRRALIFGVKLIRGLLKHVKRSDLFDAFGYLFKGMRRFGSAHVVFIVFFEYVSAMAFLAAAEQEEPEDAVLFLNMLAHVQHHYWKTPGAKNCPQLEFTAEAVDDILGKLLSRLPPALTEKTVILNALSQKCTHDEPAWILHRPKSPEKLMAYLGIYPESVQPLMTHDAHLVFAAPEQADDAFQILGTARVADAPLFHVEKNSKNPNMIFYRLDFFDEVDDETLFIHQNQTSKFKDHFISIVKRTGKHIPNGEAVSNWSGLPERTYNHDLAAIFKNPDTTAAQAGALSSCA